MKSLKERFADYCMEEHFCWNGDRLVELMEDGDIQEMFLEHEDLDLDIDIWEYKDE